MRRGTTHGADCANCPFSRDGAPNRPVVGIYPEKTPLWIIVGEGPGHFEVNRGEPFVGPSGEVVNKILAKIGRRRDEVGITNATLCLPYQGADERVRQIAQQACKTRLQLELAEHPGRPILTLGAVAAKGVIPKAALDAIDPPEGKAKRQQRRDKVAQQEKEAKKAAKREKQKANRRALFVKVALRKLVKEAKDRAGGALRRQGHKVTAHGLKMVLEEVMPSLERQADDLGQLYFEDWLQEKEAKAVAKKSKKAKKAIKISDIASTLFKVDVDHTGIRCVIPAIHPAALLRGGGKSLAGTHTPDLAFVNLVYDAGKVDALARGRDVELRFPCETETQDRDRSSNLVWQIILEAYAVGAVAIDLETYVEDQERHHALQAYVAQIRAIGFSTKEHAVSVLWENLHPWAQEMVRLLLASDRVTKIFHNGLYDRTVLAARGYRVLGPWDDTLLMHHASFPGGAHGLQIVTAQFYACQPWKSEFRNAEETPESLTLYNAKDTYATFRIWETLKFHVQKTGTQKVYETDRAKSEIFSEMHLNGIPISFDENAELMRIFSQGVLESRKAVEDVANDPRIREQIWHYLAYEQARIARKNDPQGNDAAAAEQRYNLRLEEIREDFAKGDWHWKISGGKHIAALLQALGVELTSRTDSGQTSTKKEVLESLTHVPVVRDILTFRENDKLLSTFIWQIFDRKRGDEYICYGYADEEGRVHSIWSIHKITGRVASTEPVFSNVPKAKWKKVALPDGSTTLKLIRPNLRRQVVAPRGRVFVEFDFSQLEARIIAILSGDPWLVDVFASGKDIHTECARVIFPNFDSLGDGSGKLTKMQKQLRDNTKPLEYGAFYGGSPETLWKNLLKEGFKVTLPDVTNAVSLLMRRMPGVVAWQRNCVITASRPPFEIREQLLGRRRTFPMQQVDQNEAINFGVQSFAASLMDTGMVAMHKCLDAYKQAFEILQIHDAAVYECWEEDAEAIRADVHRCYEQKVGEILFPIESGISHTWAGESLPELERRVAWYREDLQAGLEPVSIMHRRLKTIKACTAEMNKKDDGERIDALLAAAFTDLTSYANDNGVALAA
jgi:uracil-DNA glycosylase family 4